MNDAVSRFHDHWAHIHPDLDLSSMQAMGRVLRLAALMNTITDNALTQTELTRPEFEVLAALRRSPHGLNPSRLSRETLSSGAATTKRLTRLENAGLITRTTHPRDRREIQVHLTPRGSALTDETFIAQLQRESQVLTPLAPHERTQLAHLLSRVLDPLDRAHP